MPKNINDMTMDELVNEFTEEDILDKANEGFLDLNNVEYNNEIANTLAEENDPTLGQKFQQASQNVQQDAKDYVESRGMIPKEEESLEDVINQQVTQQQGLPKTEIPSEAEIQALQQEKTAPSQVEGTNQNIESQASEEDIEKKVDEQKAKNAIDDTIKAKYAERLTQLKDMTEETTQKIQAARDEIKGANVFKGGNIGNKILAGIAVMLGSIGSGLAGGQNMALQIIQKQEENIIKTNRDLLNKYENKLGSIEEAKLAIKSDYYDAIIERAQQVEAAGSPLQKAKIQKIYQEITKNNLQIQKELEEVARKKLVNKSGKLTNEQVQMLPKEKRKLVVRDFNGNPLGVADSKEGKDKVDSAIAAASTVNKTMRRVKDVWNEYGTREVLNRGIVNEMDQLRNGLSMEFKNLFELGVLQKADLEILDSYIGGGFLDLTTSDAAKKARVEGVEKYVSGKVEDALRGAGLKQVGESKTFRRK